MVRVKVRVKVKVRVRIKVEIIRVMVDADRRPWADPVFKLALRYVQIMELHLA